MLLGTPDDREVIRQTIGQIRDLYKEIIIMRNEDRQKYKEMCSRLEVLEKEKSKRLRKNRRLAKKLEKLKKKDGSKNTASTNNAAGTGAPKKTQSKNLKVDTASNDGTSKTDEKGPDKDE